MASLIDLVNQFITEHGSAPILKEHISLIKEKASEFERKLLLSESEGTVLRDENKIIKAENANLQKENADLKEKLKAYEYPVHDNLPEKQQDILILLTNSGMTETKLIAAIDRNAESIRFDLEELKEAGLIESQHWSIGEDFFSLTQHGRRYLKKNGLLI